MDRAHPGTQNPSGVALRVPAQLEQLLAVDRRSNSISSSSRMRTSVRIGCLPNLVTNDVIRAQAIGARSDPDLGWGILGQRSSPDGPAISMVAPAEGGPIEDTNDDISLALLSDSNSP